jgi:hypothetical protein
VNWRALGRRAQRSDAALDGLHAIKLRAIDAAFRTRHPSSVADLGGVWAVNGGYTFYLLENYAPAQAVLVDEEFTPEVRARARHFPQLTLLNNNFGNRSALDALGHVDAVLLFDVLLHQVNPDWDEILRMYASVTDCFVIVNPQYCAGPHSIRLIELGPDRYRALVPPQPDYDDLFDRLDEFLPERSCRYRDIHNVWQWGIVDADLRKVMRHLNFELVHFENGGRWGQLRAFENHSFVFSRAAT